MKEKAIWKINRLFKTSSIHPLETEILVREVHTYNLCYLFSLGFCAKIMVQKLYKKLTVLPNLVFYF